MLLALQLAVMQPFYCPWLQHSEVWPRSWKQHGVGSYPSTWALSEGSIHLASLWAEVGVYWLALTFQLSILAV